MDIKGAVNGLSQTISNNLSASTSPKLTFNCQFSSPSQGGRSFAQSNGRVRRGTISSYVRELKPFNTEDIKILLLENVNQIGQDILRKQELVISQVVALARQYCERLMEMHKGTWNKVSAGCWEVRGKTLGIVGYGHIGKQHSVLAEAMGMRVIFYDVVNLMSMGTAKQVPSLHELLQNADFVTLHVPESPETKNLMDAAQFDQMKQGSYLTNASRGSVVDIQAMIDASRSGKLAGAALDVYPNEPAANGDYFNNELNAWGAALRGCKNIILTPHIGGSTEEAQRAISIEVVKGLVGYINEGNTLGAVNMPEVNLRSVTAKEPNHVRVIYVHKNLPGVLWRVNEILGNHNVDKQMTDSRKDVAYFDDRHQRR